MSFEALDDVEALLDDGVLTPPVLRPRWVTGLDVDTVPADVVALASAIREQAGALL